MWKQSYCFQTKADGHINVKVEFGEGEGKVPLDNIAKRAEAYKPKERVTYKVCRRYLYTYPKCVKFYIEAYREVWEDEGELESDL